LHRLCTQDTMQKTTDVHAPNGVGQNKVMTKFPVHRNNLIGQLKHNRPIVGQSFANYGVKFSTNITHCLVHLNSLSPPKASTI
jgi:hypothetical protein